MIALPHRRAAKTPPPANLCGSHAYFWVSIPGGDLRATCAPHLPMTLAQVLDKGGQTLDLAPDPGQPCEYVEVSR